MLFREDRSRSNSLVCLKVGTKYDKYKMKNQLPGLLSSGYTTPKICYSGLIDSVLFKKIKSITI